MNKILSIIPTKNNLEFTKLLLGDLKKTKTDVLLIDNCSTDGTYEYLKSNKYEVISFDGQYNAVSEMWNTGFRFAVGSGYEFVAILNNDIRLPECWVDVCLKIFKDDSVYGVYPEYTVGNFNDFIKPTFPQNKIIDSYLCGFGMIGFCQIYRTKIANEIGYFDERFDLAWNDNDYVRRALDKELKFVSTNEFVIHHYGSQTVTKENSWFERTEKDKKKFEEKWKINA